LYLKWDNKRVQRIIASMRWYTRIRFPRGCCQQTTRCKDTHTHGILLVPGTSFISKFKYLITSITTNQLYQQSSTFYCMYCCIWHLHTVSFHLISFLHSVFHIAMVTWTVFSCDNKYLNKSFSDINVWNLTVWDVLADTFFVLPQRDLISHYWNTASLVA
jgi:hypothetical protein